MSKHNRHPTEAWQSERGTDELTPKESVARHTRMMNVILDRIEAIRLRLRGTS